MAEVPFRSAELKLERAKQHINDLKAKFDEFFADDSYAIRVIDNPETCERAIWLIADKTIPEEFSLIIGDAIHNLRSSLDHLTWEVMRPFNPVRGQVMFPFSKKAIGFEDTLSNRQIKLASKEIVERFRVLKPYPGGNDLLYGLHTLDIIDKHTLILGAASAIGFNALNLRAVDPTAPAQMPPVLMFYAETKCLMSWRYDPAIPPKKDAYLDTSFTIVFGPGQPFEGEAVLTVLRKLVIMIAGVLTSFTP